MTDDQAMRDRKASASMIEAFCEQFAKDEGVELEEVSWHPSVEDRSDEYALSISGNNYSFAIKIPHANLVGYQGGIGVGIIDDEIRDGIRIMATA